MKPKAVIFDIDGTLALIGPRGPYDWGKVGEDTLNKPVADLIPMFRGQGYAILIFSGRDAVCRGLTEAWLHEHGIEYDVLYMRPKGDKRKDVKVKREFYRDCKERFDMIYAIDDRPQVCLLWYQLGLCLLKVGDPYADF